MNSAVDLAPLLGLLLIAGIGASALLVWLWRRHRGSDARLRLAALTALTLFLTFDLIVFGAFTRLSDSGLGCPDWPGCYGTVSPLHAQDDIAAAQAVQPTGPVTHTKAWIEMTHRYLAMVVGALILALAVGTTVARRSAPLAPFWAYATLVWVIVQGIFGKYTVTWKLYPAIVTLHLLGALLLLALLVRQHEAYRDRPFTPATPVAGLHRAAWAVLLLLFLQSALGAWVSSNYAVLACQGFPQCNGAWWPDSDFAAGFSVLRPLGRTADGGYLGFEALVAIQMAHRIGALVLTLGLLGLIVALRRSGLDVARRYAALLGALLLTQLGSGLINVVLAWPLAAALLHSAGAAALAGVLTSLLARTRRANAPRARAYLGGVRSVEPQL